MTITLGLVVTNVSFMAVCSTSLSSALCWNPPIKSIAACDKNHPVTTPTPPQTTTNTTRASPTACGV
jgi:hypothetical protein